MQTSLLVTLLLLSCIGMVSGASGGGGLFTSTRAISGLFETEAKLAHTIQASYKLNIFPLNFFLLPLFLTLCMLLFLLLPLLRS